MDKTIGKRYYATLWYFIQSIIISHQFNELNNRKTTEKGVLFVADFPATFIPFWLHTKIVLAYNSEWEIRYYADLLNF